MINIVFNFISYLKKSHVMKASMPVITLIWLISAFGQANANDNLIDHGTNCSEHEIVFAHENTSQENDISNLYKYEIGSKSYTDNNKNSSMNTESSAFSAMGDDDGGSSTSISVWFYWSKINVEIEHEKE